MRFKVKKSYGEYKTPTCPFCSRIATHKTEQGLEVCHLHTKSVFEEIKCTCGSWLEQRSGKFGPYFNCIHCGNINLNKAMEIKAITMKDKPKVEEVKPKVSENNYKNESKDYKKDTYSPSNKKESYSREKKEITIDTNDVEYFS